MPDSAPVVGPAESTGDVEEEDFAFEANLFLNQEYEECSFPVGAHIIQLLVSPSACSALFIGFLEDIGMGMNLKIPLDENTDYDLTGQILWPAATLLAEYIANHSELVAGRRGACELGAGLGLVGFTALKSCPVVLTDHNEVVLAVLERNAALNPSVYGSSCVLCEWTSATDLAAVRAVGPSGGYDLVLGADVCYGQSALPAVFSAAASLLAHTPEALFLLGYVSRAASIDRALGTQSQRAGLELQEIIGTRQEVAGGLEGWICTVQWQPQHVHTRHE